MTLTFMEINVDLFSPFAIYPFSVRPVISVNVYLIKKLKVRSKKGEVYLID